MGTVVKTERSADNKFQFTLWDNGNGEFIVELRKFFTTQRGDKKQIAFNRFDRMRMTPAELEKFKVWLNHFERKDK